VSASIHLSYQRLMRWYPSEWRDRNEEAMLGALIDHAQAQGLTRPSAADGFSLRFGGLKERVLGPNITNGVGILGTLVAVAFALFYVSLTWAPGTRYSGFVGPFANPTILTTGLLVAALVLTLVRKYRVARGIIFFACVVELVIGAIAAIAQWQGPSLPAVAAFVAFGLFSVSRLHGAKRVVMLVGAVVLLLVSCEAFEVAITQVSGSDLISPSIVWPEVGVGTVALAGAAILAWPWRSLRSQRRSVPKGSPSELA
jgi:hypothetical protein